MKQATALIAAVSAACLAGPALAQSDMTENPAATATLANSDGQNVGEVKVFEAAEGVLIRVTAEGIDEGWHGFHLHETGDCSAVDFSSAGSHYAPDGKAHGTLTDNAPHAGDLPNVHADAEGKVAADVTSVALTVDGDVAPMMDDDGSAFIIHQGPDSYGEEAGAGPRIACGVVEAAS